MNILIVFGLLLIAGGISGIIFVTIPSIYGIGDGAEDIINDNVGKGVSSIIIGGLFLYFTTGLFIIISVFGGILTIAGFDN